MILTDQSIRTVNEVDRICANTATCVNKRLRLRSRREIQLEILVVGGDFDAARQIAAERG